MYNPVGKLAREGSRISVLCTRSTFYYSELIHLTNLIPIAPAKVLKAEME